MCAYDWTSVEPVVQVVDALLPQYFAASRWAQVMSCSVRCCREERVRTAIARTESKSVWRPMVVGTQTVCEVEESEKKVPMKCRTGKALAPHSSEQSTVVASNAVAVHQKRRARLVADSRCRIAI